MKSLAKKITPFWVLKLYHTAWASWGAFFHGFPSKKLTVIGVTGTNGKSTVIRMIWSILQHSGIKTAVLSTIEEAIGEDHRLNPHKGTMPGHGKIHNFLKRAAVAGCKVAVVEVTSEGVRFNRHRYISWDIVVMTNVTPEHIERHGSFEAYRGEKIRFFREALQRGGTAIVSADDESAPLFVQAVPSAEVICVSVEQQPSAPCHNMVQATNIQKKDSGMEFFVGSNRVILPLLGFFNVTNALEAIAVANVIGVDHSASASVLATVTAVPGRMERVVNDPFLVIVDYAHTPDALEKVYASLHDPGEHQGSRLLCVLGATGGGRDKWKRSVLGKIASDYCDDIILTDEDPYNEDPQAIVDSVATGFEDSKMATPPNEVVIDRREAIRCALEKAKPGDVVAITGKGSEQEMAVRGGAIPWDDRSVVREEFEELQKRNKQ